MAGTAWRAPGHGEADYASREAIDRPSAQLSRPTAYELDVVDSGMSARREPARSKIETVSPSVDSATAAGSTRSRATGAR